MKRNKKEGRSEEQAFSDALLQVPEEDISEEERPKKKKWKKVLLAIVLTLLGLIVAVVLAVLLYLNHLLNQITPYDAVNDVTVSSSEAEQIVEEDPEAVTIDLEQEEQLPDISDVTFPQEQEEQSSTVNWDNVVNILLVGQDRRPGEGRQRSDSMILVTFNKSKQTITLTSFMRDCYVQIPGYKANKLNAAYAFGGMSLLNQTLEQNFGVHVDGNIEVDFDGFQDVIDLLGGVDISLTEEEVSYMNNGLGLNGTDRQLSVGTNRLDGEQALVYARIRSIDSDYRRAERQRKVISSLIQRYKSQSLTTMLGLLEDILPLVVTNMDKGEIVDYTLELMPMLASCGVETLRIPVDGTFNQGIAKVRPGLAAWFQYDIDFSANRDRLYQVFAE